MRYYLLIASILVIVPFSAFSSSLINVPLGHWSYQFIERLQAKVFLEKYLYSSKPYSREEMAETFAHVLNLLETGKIHLTKVEMGLLEEIKKEFSNELNKLGIPVVQKQQHLLDWEEKDRKIIASIGIAQDNLTSYNGVSKLEVSFWGSIFKNTSFYNLNKASYQIGKEPSIKRQNYPGYLLWRYPWSAYSGAYIVFGNPKIKIQIGKDAIQWGTGYHGVIGLACIEPAFDAIKLRTKMWKINFTSLLGFLRNDLTEKYQNKTPKKHLSAHRFELTPISGICLAWQEVYIYADNLHPELINPIMPYQMAEDYLGEIGNNTMEGDIEIYLIPNTKLYSSLFLDDFHGDASPFKYAGWGWAILGGTMIAEPFGLDNTDILLEYTRVEPWTYTHKGTKQIPPVPTAYTNFGEPLGHWIGPNADDFFAKLSWYISKSLWGSVTYNRIRHGEIGGNIYDRPDLRIEKKFLEGIVETKRSTGIELRYTTFHTFEIGVSYKRIKTKNRQKEEAMLSIDDERRQAWKTGWNTTEDEFGIALQIRY